MHLTAQVARTIRRYRMLAPGQRVGIAVSGGADSVCLLHLLRDLAPEWDLRLTVLHLNHRLRGRESEADEEFVFQIARQFGLPFVVCHANIAGAPGNLEQSARQARLEFFRRLIREGQMDRVAVGHTRSDQAETVLFRFLRGAGTAGLAGIRPVTDWGMVRPLLDIERSGVEAFLQEHQIRWRNDATNAARRFARNRIRHELLPQLSRDWNPAIVKTLAATAEWARAEEQYWEAELDRLWNGPPNNGPVVLSTDVLAPLPEAVLHRLIRRAIHHAKGDLHAVTFRHVQQISILALSATGSERVHIPGLTVERSFHWVRFVKSPEPPAAFAIPLVPPASAYGITLELVEKPETSKLSGSVYNGETGCLDWGRLSRVLQLRNWRAGDRYRPLGNAGEEKVKTLFQNTRIPIWDRRGWPVLTDGDVIVWVRGFGPAAQFAADSGSAVVLLVRDAGG